MNEIYREPSGFPPHEEVISTFKAVLNALEPTEEIYQEIETWNERLGPLSPDIFELLCKMEDNATTSTGSYPPIEQRDKDVLQAIGIEAGLEDLPLADWRVADMRSSGPVLLNVRNAPLYTNYLDSIDYETFYHPLHLDFTEWVLEDIDLKVEELEASIERAEKLPVEVGSGISTMKIDLEGYLNDFDLIKMAYVNKGVDKHGPEVKAYQNLDRRLTERSS